MGFVHCMAVTFNHNKPGHMGDVWSTRDVIWNKSHYSQIACAVTQGRSWGPWVTSSMTTRLSDPQLAPLVQTNNLQQQDGREKADGTCRLLQHLCGFTSQGFVPYSCQRIKMQWCSLALGLQVKSMAVCHMRPRTDCSSTLDRRPKQNNRNSRKLMNRKGRG